MGKELYEMTMDELWTLFPIILEEYSPKYNDWYEEEAKFLYKILGENIIERINHIGSSGIPNLIAKPTVDILLELKSLKDMDDLINILKANGWLLMSSQTVPYVNYSMNKGYTKEGFSDKVFHLHIRASGDWDEPYFRKYLENHPSVCQEYSYLKKALQTAFKNNRDAYTAAKSDFIGEHTLKARNVCLDGD